MTRVARRSAVVLWLLAPALLWLTVHRPFTAASGRAARVPALLDGFTLAQDHALTPRELQLLGTDDAAWRTYRDRAGSEAYVVVVFHQENWKSVHPPHLCLRGSDMRIESDEQVALPLADASELVVGRITTTSRTDGRRYLCLYLYGARDLRTGSYARFVLHHLPRAVLRRAAPGYLLRVETWIDGDEAAAQARCQALLGALVPHLEANLDG